MRGSDDTWVVLMHVPADPSMGGSLFADPRFADHVAFLDRMKRPATSWPPGHCRTGPARG